jgi:hypothetical protein
MRLVTLATLRDDSKLYANQRSSTFLSDAEWDRFINQAGTTLWDLLVSARGHEYYEQNVPLNTSPGSAIVALPQDFYQLITVIANWGSQQLEELDSLDHLGDQTTFRNWGQWGQYSPKVWRVRGAPSGHVLEFFPTPSAVTPLEVRYIPTWTDLESDSSTYDGINGFERLIALRAAIDALTLQNLPAAGQQQLYDREYDRIETMARDRAAANPPTIRDVRFGEGRGRWDRLPWPVSDP